MSLLPPPEVDPPPPAVVVPTAMTGVETTTVSNSADNDTNNGNAAAAVVLPVCLTQPGPLGLVVRRVVSPPASTSSASSSARAPAASPATSTPHTLIESVTPNSQASKAGILPGDVITYPGSKGTIGIPYDFFMHLCGGGGGGGGGGSRPVVFEIRRSLAVEVEGAAKPAAADSAATAATKMDTSRDDPTKPKTASDNNSDTAAAVAAVGSKRPFLTDLTNNSSTSSSANGGAAAASTGKPSWSTSSSTVSTATTASTSTSTTAMSTSSSAGSSSSSTEDNALSGGGTEKKPPPGADDDDDDAGYLRLLAKIEGATAKAATAKVAKVATNGGAGGAGRPLAAAVAGSSSSNATTTCGAASSSSTSSSAGRVPLLPLAGSVQTSTEPTSSSSSSSSFDLVHSKKPPPPPPAKMPPKKKKKKAAETIYEDVPSPGFVCSTTTYYATVNNETLCSASAKLGCEWRDLINPNNECSENIKRYGKLNSSSKFREGTLLRIPRTHSKWKVRALVDGRRAEEERLAKCTKCGGVERPDCDEADDPMLICDGCDATCHLKCANGNMTAVPDTDWFCSGCTDILRARRAKHGSSATAGKKGASSSSSSTAVPSSSLRATLPPLPPLGLDEATRTKHAELHRRLSAELRKRRDVVSAEMTESNRVVRAVLRNRIPELEDQVEAARIQKNRTEEAESRARQMALSRNGLVDFGGENKNEYSRSTWIKCRVTSGRTSTFHESSEVELKRQGGGWYGRITGVKPSENWRILSERRSDVLADRDYRRAIDENKRDQAAWERCREEFREANSELRHSDAVEADQRKLFELEYTALLGELPEMEGDVKGGKKKTTKEFPPKLLGLVCLADEGDINTMSMLLEPDELVIFLPYHATQLVSCSSGGNEEHTLNNLFVGGTYAVFARQALFDRKRDDAVPIDGNGQRDAQRALMRLLQAEGSNGVAVVSRAKVPPSVRLRGEDGVAAAATNCGMFDLSELVRDCNADLDIALEPTPPRMEENGLELRMYQQASLRWLLDKEMDSTGMGFAGELWDRMRFFSDGGNAVYYCCELTGTFCLDIFDFRDDVGQKDAAMDFGGFQTGGILGEEMGLGKTIVCLSLIVSNPPPNENRVLKREHIWSLEKHAVDHPDYLAPPSVVGAITSSPNISLSNGTLVIVPMTLISQWQSEIERFAPWLNVITLHNADNPKPQEIASADVVVMSTTLLQGLATTGSKSSGKGKKAPNTSRHLLNAVRKIHWHRIMIDEAHYNNVGQRTKQVLASLSATHRHCVTGTPVGNTLDDLQGQLRFLRLPQFCRWEFWQNNISDPYYGHNSEALRILRSLLSRIVIRHSKEQTLQGGQSLVSLPPRSVETELIPFGTKEEQKLYDFIEKRNRENFERLRQESTATLANNTMELQFMLLCARQACSHSSMIDLVKLDRMNQRTDPKYMADVEAAKNSGDASTHQATRASILASAAAKARPSAQARVRSVILKFQDGGSDLMECPICLETVGEINVACTPCGHPFCSECVLNVLDAATSSREAQGDCPTCRTRFGRSELTLLGEAADAGERKTDEADEAMTEEQTGPVVADVNGFQITATEVKVAVKGSSTLRVGYNKQSLVASRESRREDAAMLPTLSPQFLADFDASDAKIGSKVAFLLQAIDQMSKDDPSAKAVVFSQFVPLLDVASQELTARGIRFVRIYGSDKQHQRADALLDFSSDPGIKIFLLSMRAGAVGLNLTAANSIFILDAPQNSALEEQAIDRVHRIGQSRPVMVKRFIAKGTVEERIIQVRRNLSNDLPTTGTQVCDASLMTNEGAASKRPAKRARTEEPEVEDDSQDYDRQQERLEKLATLFGTTLVPSVFKA